MLRTSSLRPVDVVVPTAITALGAVEYLVTSPPGWGLGLALDLTAGALLVWRRVYPLFTCTTAAVIALVGPWIGPQLDDVATPILLVALICYSLARWIENLRGLVGIGVILSSFLVDYLTVDQRGIHDITDAVFVLALVVPPYVFGRITRRLALQSELLLRHQEQERAEAVRAERDRIARDLHDVIAHSISVMVVQTAAAQDLMGREPDRALGLLDDVTDAGRRALSETGRLLHVLRDDGDELGLRPAPGLSRLPELVQQFRDQGLAVRADLPDPVPVLPASVDVSAYRIVQEVLTNAMRYAVDKSVLLRVASTGSTLSIRSSNPADGRPRVGSGLGLLGVAERVKVLGGHVTHGTSTDGRFELEAVLPVGGT